MAEAAAARPAATGGRSFGRAVRSGSTGGTEAAAALASPLGLGPMPAASEPGLTDAARPGLALGSLAPFRTSDATASSELAEAAAWRLEAEAAGSGGISF